MDNSAETRPKKSSAFRKRKRRKVSKKSKQKEAPETPPLQRIITERHLQSAANENQKKTKKKKSTQRGTQGPTPIHIIRPAEGLWTDKQKEKEGASTTSNKGEKKKSNAGRRLLRADSPTL